MDKEIMNEEVTIEETETSENAVLEPTYDGVPTEELVPAIEGDIINSAFESDDPKTGIVLAIGAGAAALAGLGTAMIIKHVKGKRTKDEDGESEEPETKDKALKKGKREKVKAKRGRKLSLIERINGHVYEPIGDPDNEKDEPENKDEAE